MSDTESKAPVPDVFRMEYEEYLAAPTQEKTLSLQCPICNLKFAFHKQEQVDMLALHLKRHTQENAQLRAAVDSLPSVTGLSPIQRLDDLPLAIRDLQERYKSAARSRNGEDLAVENAQLKPANEIHIMTLRERNAENARLRAALEQIDALITARAAAAEKDAPHPKSGEKPK